MKKTSEAKKEEVMEAVEPVISEQTSAESETKAGKEKKKKSPKRVLNTIINILLVVVIIIAAACTYVAFVHSTGAGAPSILGVQLLSIQTDSMYPFMNAGDMAIDFDIQSRDKSFLRPKDIITYWTVIEGKRVLNTHRIENIYDGGGYLIFETKGDANTNVDPLTVHESEVVGVYKFHIPGIGKVFDYLQEPVGFFLIVLIPVILFFLYHLVQFFRALFEYQNVKNRIKFEQERGRTEDLLAAQQAEMAKKEAERAQMEAELREKLRAELLASMAEEKKAEAAQVEAEAPAEDE